MVGRTATAAAALWMLHAAALAQQVGTVTATPLQPPGLAARPPVAAAARPPSVLGHVPVVHPPRTAARHPARKHPAHAPQASGAPAAKTGLKPGTKLGAKPGAEPAAPAGAAPTASAPAPPKPAAPAADLSKGTTTGLPLPRWAAFRSDDVNLRTGPGMQYPIDWVYHRRDLPVRIEREFEVWRLVELEDGTKGWVHQATLTGRRGFVVQNGDHVLRAGPDDTAEAVAELKQDVVGLIRSCAQNGAWCQVEAGGYRGWLKRTDLYGVSADEGVE